MLFGKKYRALVVDDDEDMLLLLERVLSKARCKVFKAVSGKECIEQARRFSPDIIILDIMMPDLDGIATVLKLKSIQETRSIPIIMCTAVKEGEDEIVARNLGITDYVRKTPKMEGLVDKIERALNK